MNEESAFLQAMLADPGDLALRLVFADWLEERGDLRGELLRLTHTLTQAIDVPDRAKLETRMRVLLEQGVQPIGPFWTNSIGMRFAWVPPGTFLMGSPESEETRQPNETQHKVTLTKGFYTGVHLVTQDQWQAVMGHNPSQFKGETNLPVDSVSWDDCQTFIEKLQQKDNKRYRLPTEAEWEYACRAGTTTPFHFGDTISTDQANYLGDFTYGKGKKGEYPRKTTPVGSLPANAWGLFDLHGNLWEWCQDRYGSYPNKNVVDPRGPKKGSARVLRGGSWFDLPRNCRSASRDHSEPGDLSWNIGFRVVCCLD